MLRHRLNPAAYQRAATLSEYFDVDAAQSAGLFDAVVEPGELMQRARAHAEKLQDLDERAHTFSKRRIRRSLIRRLRFSVPLDLLDAILLGMRGGKPR
jgi:enoyl-CoA hydratase/carnithine racemase